jgi:hypothetical protein
MKSLYPSTPLGEVAMLPMMQSLSWLNEVTFVRFETFVCQTNEKVLVWCSMLLVVATMILGLAVVLALA